MPENVREVEQAGYEWSGMMHNTVLRRPEHAAKMVQMDVATSGYDVISSLTT